MTNAVTINSVETVNGRGEISTIFSPFTDLLVLRVVFSLSNDLASLPDIQALLTFTIIAAQSNQSVASFKTSVPVGANTQPIVWTPSKTPHDWGLLLDQGDIFGLRVFIVLNSGQQQLDEFAVSDIRWFRLKEEFAP